MVSERTVRRDGPTPVAGPPSTPPSRRRRLRGLRRVTAAVLALLLAATSWSLGRVLLAPSTDSVSARAAEWARNHGLGPLVTAGETVQYWLNPPKVGGTPDVRVLQRQGAASRAARRTPAAGAITLHPPLAPIRQPALPGEGVFRPVETVHGQPAVQVAYLRPDQAHSSYLAGVVWMSGRLTRLVQHPGAEDPGSLSRWSQPDRVPPAERPGLLATFNSGFRLRDSRGGYYADGHTAGSLVKGAASLVVYRDGHATVGAWGGPLHLGPDVVSVRQNLQLLVDNGRIVGDLSHHVQSTWGGTVAGAYYVWRSGIGVTASGDLVYVAGDALSVHSLAVLLHRAGAVRGMELDINTAWISYMWYSYNGNGAVPHKLAAFWRPADRYFLPSSRDFFAVYGR